MIINIKTKIVKRFMSVITKLYRLLMLSETCKDNQKHYQSPHSLQTYYELEDKGVI